MTTGVGASKFWGVQKIFSQIFPNLHKTLSCNFCDRFLARPPKDGLRLFFCKRWAEFFEVNKIWRHFRPDLKRFAQICGDFARFFREFARIFNKSKFLGCERPHFVKHPPPPTPLSMTATTYF